MLAGFHEPYRDVEHVPAWLYALSCFRAADATGRQPPGGSAAAAEKLAQELMHEAEECVRSLIIQLHQVRSRDCCYAFSVLTARCRCSVVQCVALTILVACSVFCLGIKPCWCASGSPASDGASWQSMDGQGTTDYDQIECPAQLTSSLQDDGGVTPRPASAGTLHGRLRGARRVAPHSCEVPCHADDRAAHLALVSQVCCSAMQHAMLQPPYWACQGCATPYNLSRGNGSCNRRLQWISVGTPCTPTLL